MGANLLTCKLKRFLVRGYLNLHMVPSDYAAGGFPLQKGLQNKAGGLINNRHHKTKNLRPKTLTRSEYVVKKRN